MEEKTITLTEAELQAKIDESVSKATEALISKHNGEMASLRTQHKNEIEKVKKEAGMSAEEIAKQKADEMAQVHEQEFQRLKSFEKQTILEKRLVKEGLPAFLVNDSRLLSAEEGDLDKVIKTVKGEFLATQPKGSNHSTVVQQGGTQTPQKNQQEQAFVEMGEALGKLLG